MAAFAAAEKFLAGHLEGRFQPGATTEVTSRLREITVNPATVVLAKAVDVSATKAPAPVHQMQAGTFNYAARIEMGGQTIPLKTSITAVEDGSTWVVTQTTTVPGGDQTDRTVIGKSDLGLRSRAVRQGPVTIDLAVADGKISGRMAAGAQGADISAPVDGILFADGAAGPLVLATLPLADGYTTVFRNFDLQPPKVRTVKLTVTGSEQVTVPAGAFDTFRIELTSSDDENKTIYWVAKESRKVVKGVASGPQLNGGSLTVELAP
jgi:hypothetical protein